MKFGLTIATFILIQFNLYPQSCANYTATRTTSISYTSILSTGAAIPSWRNNSGNLEQDDNRSNAVDIGFDFWYLGTRYTQFCVSTNGFIDLNVGNTSNGTGTGAYGYSNSAFTNRTSLTALGIAPVYDDFTTQGAGDPLGSSIKYQVDGTFPNKVLTIEWINMAVYGDTTPDLNFQVKLYEFSGVIEFVYGTMTPGGASYSYSCGINSSSQSNTATAAQLKNQITANTATFSNAETNNLSALPASNSKITLTPPTPTTASGSLTFNTITKTSMNLSWTNWATGHLGYIIFNSTDGTNFNFVAQNASGTVTYSATGLVAGTTYYWRIYAVSEGSLGTTYLSGTQATLAPGTFTSTGAGGFWDVGSTWIGGTAPTSGDDVIIANGTTVTIQSNVSCNSLQIGQGASGILQIGSGGAARSLTVNNGITVNSGAILRANTTSANTLTLSNGNIVNNGSIDLSTGTNICNLTITKNGNVTLSGSGSTNRYNNITLTMGTSVSNVFEVTSSTFTAASGFLTINYGTFKYSASGTTNITPFNANQTLTVYKKIWVNAANATVNLNGTITLQGSIQLTTGTLNIGNAANQNLRFDGGSLSIAGGTLNVAGVIDRVNTSSIINYTQSAGDVYTCKTGCGTSSNYPLTADVDGSVFNVSNGTIQICNGVSNRGFYLNGITGASFSGGTLVVGNSFSSGTQTIQINTSSTIPNLQVNNANVTAQLNTNSLTVSNNVTISAGTFNANNLNVTVGGDWLNNSNAFVPGTGTVTFSKAGSQNISRTTGTESFYNLNFNTSGTKTLGSAITANNLSVANGVTLDVSASNYNISLTGNWTNSGSFIYRNGTVTFNGTSAQNIIGATDWYNITINNSAGVNISSGSQNLYNKLTPTLGTFSTGANNFTLKASSTNTARIGAFGASSSFSGNAIVESFAAGGTTGWASLGTTNTGGTLAKWLDDFPMAGFTGATGAAGGFVSVYTYNESINDSSDYRWVAATNITNALTPGKGYLVYLGDGATSTNDITIETDGAITQGNFNFGVTYLNSSLGSAEDGWNLIANPYPSAIDWDAAGWTKTNVSGTIYVYNADIGNYATYSTGGASTNGGSRYIAAGQGFFVKASAASPSLILTESCKTDNNPNLLRLGSNHKAQPGFIRVKAQGYANFKDETVIRFLENATSGFDGELDAYKLNSMDYGAINISTINQQKELSINSFNTSAFEINIPLLVTTTVSTQTSLTLDGLNYFPIGTCLTLEDIYTNQIIDLNYNNTYTFNLSDTTKHARFIIHVINPVNVNVINPDCFNTFSGIKLNSLSSIGNVEIYNLNNTLIKSTSLSAGTSTDINLNPGTYIIKTNQTVCANSIDTISIVDERIEVSADFVLSNDTVFLSESTILSPINISVNAENYHWLTQNEVYTDFAPNINVSDTGYFQLQLIAQTGTCTDTISNNYWVVNQSPLGIKNINQKALIIYQNKDNIILKCNSKKDFSISIFDIKGAQVLSNNYLCENNEILIPVSRFNTGVYLLKLDADFGTETYRFVVN